MTSTEALIFGAALLAVAVTTIFLLFLVRKRLSKQSHWSRVLFINAIIIVGMISLLFAGGEFYYRFIYEGSGSYRPTTANKEWAEKYYRINNWGVRESIDYTNDIPDSKIRITFIGDSTTEGSGIDDVNLRFGNLVRKNRSKDWDVQVFGLSGASTDDEIRFLLNCFRDRDYKTDVVVLIYDPNDICNISKEFIEFNNAGIKKISALQENFIVRHSRFIEQTAVQAAIARMLPIEEYVRLIVEAHDGDAWRRQEIRLRLMQCLCHLHGAELMMVSPSFTVDRIPRFCKEAKIPFLDLSYLEKQYDSKQMVVSDTDGHPSAFAHSLYAERVEKFIEANAKLGGRKALGSAIGDFEQMLNLDWSNEGAVLEQYKQFLKKHPACGG